MLYRVLVYSECLLYERTLRVFKKFLLKMWAWNTGAVFGVGHTKFELGAIQFYRPLSFIHICYGFVGVFLHCFYMLYFIILFLAKICWAPAYTVHYPLPFFQNEKNVDTSPQPKQINNNTKQTLKLVKITACHIILFLYIVDSDYQN